ncbi:hypothetical protein HIM_01963 [Hirsutella minnesotensis 3608]|nr:hypothetical protein HIM_01963 [Hirsutella minnesotensis 3608]
MFDLFATLLSYVRMPRQCRHPAAPLHPLVTILDGHARTDRNSSVTSFLLPIFASYKALKTSDPAQLTPWLMYWVVFNCCLLVESWVSFILVWIPFYGYIRFFFFLYLILPQTQGARLIYEEKIHPFLEDNEGTIDDFIADAHDRIKAAGWTYMRQAIEYIKTQLLGLPPSEQEPPAPPPPTNQGYTQSLLARFSVPKAKWAGTAAANTGSEFYNLLSNAVAAAAGAAGSSSGGGASAESASLIPPNVRGSAEKMNFIAAQRERLNIVLSALDREAQELRRDAQPDNQESPGRRRSSGLSKSRSETDFEKLEAESGAEDEDEGALRRRHVSGPAGNSWMPWGWGGGAGSAKSTSREE